MKGDEDVNVDHHDPHLDGVCCHACGFATALEKSGAAPPPPGTPLVFPIGADGVPRGAAVVVRRTDAGAVADIVDVKRADVVFGRAKDADVVLPSAMIARRQSVLRFTSSGVVVEDSRSGCGTFVNGKRIVAAPVCAGDRIYVGDYIIEVRGG